MTKRKAPRRQGQGGAPYGGPRAQGRSIGAPAQDSVIRFLQAALAHRQRGDLAAAEQACRQALALAPDHPDGLHLLGLLQATAGDREAGEQLMRRSLDLAPDQPHVWNNLGNLLRDKGDTRAAIDCYRRATGLKADYGDAWYNLGLALSQDGAFAEARRSLEQAARLCPADPRIHNALGTVYRELDRLDDAIASYRRALDLKPQYFRALHNLGVALKMAERPEEALECYDKALEINGQVPELFYNLGNALYEVGQIDNAVAAYRRALELRPDYLDAHETLNKLFWQHGAMDRYLKSYPPAIQRSPKSLELRLRYADWLTLAQRDREAEAVMREAIREIGPDGRLHHHLAKALANQTRTREALEHFETALRLAPNIGSIRLDYARLLIIIEDYDKALHVLAAFEDLAPFDQQYLAYKGLCWRFLGDPREPALNDYERFVRPIRLAPPEGYRDIDEFNKVLNRTLDAYHRTKVHPADQTLRGGTQTQGSLFTRNNLVIRQLRECIERAVRQYIADMEDDPSHPLLCRKSSKFRFAGSWSCRLRGRGFHVNHVHAEGWISSSYYVSLPDVVKNGDGHQGWIKFGETSLSLGSRERISRLIQPQEGVLVLFPSYFYHGTIPFDSDSETRTTTPFDVVPV